MDSCGLLQVAGTDPWFARNHSLLVGRLNLVRIRVQLIPKPRVQFLRSKRPQIGQPVCKMRAPFPSEHLRGIRVKRRICIDVLYKIAKLRLLDPDDCRCSIRVIPFQPAELAPFTHYTWPKSLVWVRRKAHDRYEAALPFLVFGCGEPALCDLALECAIALEFHPAVCFCHS